MTYPADDRPIIVGGCHRSGTSLLRRVLDSHSRIHCGPEVPFFRDLRGDYVHDPVGHLRFMSAARTMLPDDELLIILGQSFLALHREAARRAGKPRWADKAPENVLHTDGWQRLLDDGWLFLHVVRNPLDTLSSMGETPFPRTLPRDIGDRAAFYRRYVEAGLAFVEAHPDRARTVVYEELATDPVATIWELMAWLGEHAEATQLRFNDVYHDQGLEDPKVSRTQGVHRDSVGRWRRELSAHDARTVWSLTSPVWRRVDFNRQWIDEV